MSNNEWNVDDKVNECDDGEQMDTSKKRKRDTEVNDDSSGSEGEYTDEEGSDDEDAEDESDCESNDEVTDSDHESESGEEEDEDGEEDEDEDEEDGSDESESDSVSSKRETTKVTADNLDSDASNDRTKHHREVCAICLSYMKGEIGSPELCDHSFCLECILAWAKTNNSCPQDRTQFLQVFVRKKVKGRIIRTITVAEVKPDDIPEEEDEEPTFCEVCGRCDREDTLLLCDGCDSAHHLECLSPPLSFVPIEEWLCSECIDVNRGKAAAEEGIELEEVSALLDDTSLEQRLTERRRATASSSTTDRRVPRTRASERVLRRITRARTLRGDDVKFMSLSENSDEDESGVDDRVPTSSSQVKPPAKKRRKVTIKRKRKRKVKRKTTTKKRKVTKKKTSTTTTTKKRKKRKTTVKRKRKTTTKKGKGRSKKKGLTSLETPFWPLESEGETILRPRHWQGEKEWLRLARLIPFLICQLVTLT